MQPQLTIRESDAPFVHSVTRWVIGDHDRSLATPDGRWDLVFLKQGTKTNIMLTGQTTAAVPLRFTPGDELLTISFKPSTFLTYIPASELLDRALFLSQSQRRFQLAADSFEIPTFDNADSFILSLIKKGQLGHDEVVEAQLMQRPVAYTQRSIQRRFLRATGMSQAAFRQILRARQAAELLQAGHPAIEVAYAAGYADQAHMSRSLKRIFGHTPSTIAQLDQL